MKPFDKWRGLTLDSRAARLTRERVGYPYRGPAQSRFISSTRSDGCRPPIPTHFVHLDAPSERRVRAGGEGCWMT